MSVHAVYRGGSWHVVCDTEHCRIVSTVRRARKGMVQHAQVTLFQGYSTKGAWTVIVRGGGA